MVKIINKEINRLTISRHDLEQCLQFLHALSNHELTDIAYEALLLSAIISYARPFSCNEKDINAKADKRITDAVISELSQEHFQMHEKILILRNKAVAHKEWSHHPTSISASGVITSAPFTIWNHFLNSTDIDCFISLVHKVRNKADHLTADKLRNIDLSRQ